MSESLKIAIVIPARYASVRLPGKPLLKATGKYLIQHVYEAASKSRVPEVAVATDDERIYQAVQSFGGKVYMTSSNHPSGTDRIAEVATFMDADIFINVQGDEPEISVQAIDTIATLLEQNRDASVATLAFPITAQEARDPDLVKVVFDQAGYALYFSRAPIPYHREFTSPCEQNAYWGHMGMYAYSRAFLETYSSLTPSKLENMEKLEQLRVLENGYKILVGKTDERNRGIDTPDDYQVFVERQRCLHD